MITQNEIIEAAVKEIAEIKNISEQDVTTFQVATLLSIKLCLCYRKHPELINNQNQSIYG